MAFYVRRTSQRNPAGMAFVGPIRSAAQAERERDAWAECGEQAEVLEATAEVRSLVRRWDRVTHAADAGEEVTFRGERMTMGAYRLFHEV